MHHCSYLVRKLHAIKYDDDNDDDDNDVHVWLETECTRLR